MRAPHRRFLAVPVVAFAVLLTSCGSSAGGKSGSTSDTAHRRAAAAAAAALVSRFGKPQPALQLPPLPARPAAGKTVAILTCGFPACQALVSGAAKGAAALGWTVKKYTTQITPEAYVASWNQLLQTPPNLIVFTGLLPNAVIKAQLARVSQLKIPAVAIGSSDAPDNVMRAVLGGPAQASQSGTLMGAQVVHDAGSHPAKALFVWDPAQKDILGPARTTFRTEIQNAGGSVSDLAVASADTGRTIPGQVVSYLQAHPDITYVAFAVSDLGTGVPEAMRSAGIRNVKTISRWPQPSDLSAVRLGTEWSQVTEEGAASGYRAIDTLARILAGRPFATNPPGWHQIMTRANVTNPDANLIPPGVPQVFLTAWHVAS